MPVKQTLSWTSTLAVHLVIIIALGLIIYANTFDVSFVYDDSKFIVNNPFIKDFGYFLKPSRADALTYMEGTDTLKYFKTRYVGFLTLWANYWMHGLDVAGYHYVNLALHIVNAILVYLLVISAFGTSLLGGSYLGGRSRRIALFSGLLFVAHPLQTEGVTYMLSRFVLLTATFYLLTLVLYITARQSGMTAKKEKEKSLGAVLPYCCAVLTCLLAMNTKENAFTLPVTILLSEVLFFREGVKKRAAYLAPFFVTMLIIPLRYIMLNVNGDGFSSALEGATRLEGAPPRLDYLFTQFRVILRYIGLLLFPVGQNLDHTQQAYHSFFTPQALGSFLVLLSILCLGGYLIYRSRSTDSGLRVTAFGLFLFFIALSVESSVIPISELMVEYRIYLPCSGFLMSLVTLLFTACRGQRPVKALTAALAGSVLVLAFAAHARNGVWKTSIDLWEDVVKKSPDKPRGYNNLGVAYEARGLSDKAMEQYKIAIGLSPTFANAHNNLGNSYMRKELTDDAIQQYRIAITLRPTYADAHNNLGTAYERKGLADKAILHYKTAVELMPMFEEAHNNLGTAYYASGQTDKAIDHYEIVTKLNRDHAEAYYNLANVYQSMDLTERAIEYYITALEARPDFAAAHNNLAVLYLNKGVADKAVEHLQISLELKPDNAQSHFNLGIAYLREGRDGAAKREFESVLELKPNHEKAREHLERLKRNY